MVIVVVIVELTRFQIDSLMSIGILGLQLLLLAWHCVDIVTFPKMEKVKPKVCQIIIHPICGVEHLICGLPMQELNNFTIVS